MMVVIIIDAAHHTGVAILCGMIAANHAGIRIKSIMLSASINKTTAASYS
jgi:hypothetical protein